MVVKWWLSRGEIDFGVKGEILWSIDRVFAPVEYFIFCSILFKVVVLGAVVCHYHDHVLALLDSASRAEFVMTFWLL